jgi:Ala-tRNA(Pro) deacylase
VFTVEQSRSLHARLPGMHSKNLFLKDAGDRLWLLTAEADRRVDLKALPDRIGAKRLSFGKPELLMETLGVIVGAVTPFALINDLSHRVTFVLDRAMAGATLLNFHPLENTATTAVTPDGLKRFLAATGHGWQTVDLGAG